MLGEAVELLRRICDEGLLTAIADGTFGITRRPPDGGRGLDGVIQQADGYFNPAAEMLEIGTGAGGRHPAGEASPDGSTPVTAPPTVTPPGASHVTGEIIRPYGDTTGDGRVQVSFTLPVPFGTPAERARAEGAALQLAAKMGLEPAMVVHAKGMGPDFTFCIVYGRVGHLVDLSQVTVTEREFPLLAAEINRRIRAASAGSWSSSAPASAPTRTRSASTRS